MASSTIKQWTGRTVAGVVCFLMVLGSAGAAADLRLAEAAKNQDKEAIRSFLAERVDVNTPYPDGATALTWAVHWEDVATVDLLIGAGADVDVANDYGVTPLSLATKHRNPVLVERLLKAGADPNAARWTGETPLMTAAATGNAEIVELLLAHGADPNARENRRGQTALMWAISYQNPQVTRLLIDHGADVHARTKKLELEGFTPMVLHGYGEDVEATPPGGYTPLLFAARVGDLESARLLLEGGADVNAGTPQDGSPLVVASASGHEQLALFLLEKGADPDATDGTEMTPLHYALRDGMKVLHGIDITKVVRICGAGAGARCVALEDIADPSQIDPALLQGVQELQDDNRGKESILPGSNMKSLVQALLEKGADVNARLVNPPARLRLYRKPLLSLSGATPFLLATASGDLEAMRALLDRGAESKEATVTNPEEFYKEGHGDDNQIQANATPFMVAVGMGRRDNYVRVEQEKALEAAKILVGMGADVNEATATGWTPLHAAAFMGADPLVEFLVENGAQVNVRNGCGQTPLTLAAGTEARGLLQRVSPNPDTAKLLRKLGADPKLASEPVGRCVEGRFGLEYATVKEEPQEQD